MQSGVVRVAMLLSFLAMSICACGEKKPKPGEVCKIEDEGTVVCADATTALLCKASRRAVIPCRGAKGCSVDEKVKTNKRASCDRSLGREGEACYVDEVFGVEPDDVCSEDKKTVLACKNGKFVVDLHCRGPNACDATKPHPARFPDRACDRSVGAVGDACNTRSYNSESLGTCSIDGKEKLVCDKDDKGKWVTSRICGAGCKPGHLDGDRDFFVPVCDPGSITDGTKCAKDDVAACSADGTSLLDCDHAAGKYVAKPCGAKRKCQHERGMLARCSET